jgi:hypothetical protein
MCFAHCGHPKRTLVIGDITDEMRVDKRSSARTNMPTSSLQAWLFEKYKVYVSKSQLRWETELEIMGDLEIVRGCLTTRSRNCNQPESLIAWILEQDDTDAAILIYRDSSRNTSQQCPWLQSLHGTLSSFIQHTMTVEAVHEAVKVSLGPVSRSATGWNAYARLLDRHLTAVTAQAPVVPPGRPTANRFRAHYEQQGAPSSSQIGGAARSQQGALRGHKVVCTTNVLMTGRTILRARQRITCVHVNHVVL